MIHRPRRTQFAYALGFTLLWGAMTACGHDGPRALGRVGAALVCAPAMPALAPATLAHGPTAIVAEGDAGWNAPSRSALEGIPGLVSHWPLDGSFADTTLKHPLSPRGALAFSPSPFVSAVSGQAYGPTGTPTANGATAQTFTTVDDVAGVTLSGWVFLPDAGASGTLFGFGDPAASSSPKLVLSSSAGHLVLDGGDASAPVSLRYGAWGDACFHHVAIVVPANRAKGGALSVFVDGRAVAAENGAPASVAKTALFGQPFGLGVFSGASAGAMRVDDVRVWARALSASEVVLAANPTGGGPRCQPPASAAWNAGARRVPSTAYTPGMDLSIRVLADDAVVVVSDPSAWLRARWADECGGFLRGLTGHAVAYPALNLSTEYSLSLKETLIAHRPPILAALSQPDHFEIGSCAGPAAHPLTQQVWPQALRELHVPLLRDTGGDFATDEAELAYFSFLKLPFHMQQGKEYALRDTWGNVASLVYDAGTPSWALKTNQLGYLPDAGAKYAYLGAWLGEGGAMDVARFVGKTFSVVSEPTGAVAFAGGIGPAAGDVKWNGKPVRGETVLTLDFSALHASGTYHVSVAGLGVSRSFVVAQDALGEAFYTHARGLFHARCGMDLLPKYTPWHRGDNHTTTLRGGFPPEDADYVDHAAEGWGFRDAQGDYVAVTPFSAVAASTTSQVVSGVRGGWHDAGDFDRNGWHLGAVAELAEAYLLFPENFTDGQLSLPESGNQIPDLLDEAIWGLEVFRLTQQADGRVSTRIEATRHPLVWDPALDPAPYYMSLATRTSSLRYAASAAVLARALSKAGATARAALYLDSARRAYAFGTGPVRATAAFAGSTYTWTEAPAPDPSPRLHAAIQLLLATGDATYRTELFGAASAAQLEGELFALQDNGTPFDFVDLALDPVVFPPGWGAKARAAIGSSADGWIAGQSADPYHKVWYPTGHRYFGYLRWGASGFAPLRHLFVAWRLTGDSQYRTAALLGVDWMHGANPQGRVSTTGLGATYPVAILDLPSFASGLADPVPGITIFGYAEPTLPAVAGSRVSGLFEGKNPAYGFVGASLAQLPGAATTLPSASIASVLESTVPIWRRATAMENANPSTTEFTVYQTIAPAAVVTGCLLGHGWTPSPALVSRQPKSAASLRDALWVQP